MRGGADVDVAVPGVPVSAATERHGLVCGVSGARGAQCGVAAGSVGAESGVAGAESS